MVGWCGSPVAATAEVGGVCWDSGSSMVASSLPERGSLTV